MDTLERFLSKSSPDIAIDGIMYFFWSLWVYRVGFNREPNLWIGLVVNLMDYELFQTFPMDYMHGNQGDLEYC